MLKIEQTKKKIPYAKNIVRTTIAKLRKSYMYFHSIAITTTFRIHSKER